MGLGDKFKQAEDAFDMRVPNGGFLVVRIDGKAFHTFTKGFKKPFDENITYAMTMTMSEFCKHSDIPVCFGYTQSDEISLLIPNDGQPYFGGRVQKIVSVAASYAGAYFNASLEEWPPAVFDARVLHLQDFTDVYSYFLWRKADANRNAMSAVAQAYFPHKELQGKKRNELFDMVAHKAPEALPIPSRHFNGSYAYSYKEMHEGLNLATGEHEQAMRTRWTVANDDGMFAILTKQLLPSEDE